MSRSTLSRTAQKSSLGDVYRGVTANAPRLREQPSLEERLRGVTENAPRLRKLPFSATSAAAVRGAQIKSRNRLSHCFSLLRGRERCCACCEIDLAGSSVLTGHNSSSQTTCWSRLISRSIGLEVNYLKSQPLSSIFDGFYH